ncbi:MAG: hypothetical protein WA830_13960 [Candidatus Sulfotelmatobacter sp.]
MLRHQHLLWLAALPLLAVQPLLAINVQVGSCKKYLPSYPTISAAVSAVPPGSTVQVCPGIYPEQVTITEPLNLTGVANGTADQVLITVPALGLVENTVSTFGEPVAAQVLVQSAAPVNITNISVDGTGGDMACALNTWIAGIFYTSTSSGTVLKARASNQTDGGCGVGIWAENSDSESQSITIQNSSVYNVDNAGIFTASSYTPSSLSVSLIANDVNAAGVSGIFAEGVTGVVRNNDINNVSVGVFAESAVISATSNTIIASGFGMFLGSGATAVGNHVIGSNFGVLLDGSGATINNNRIVSSAAVGVELDCFTATVNGNFINDAPIGIDQAPAGIGPNNFANAATTITNGCVTPTAVARTVRAKSQGQWHTPATPLGTRTK